MPGDIMRFHPLFSKSKKKISKKSLRAFQLFKFAIAIKKLKKGYTKKRQLQLVFK